MTILVPGNAGFIGSKLTPFLLDCGYRVRGLDNLNVNNGDGLITVAQDSNFEFIKGDIRNSEDVRRALIGVDAVIDLAALVGQPSCHRNPKLSREVNVEGTKTLLKYAPRSIPFIYASTGSVYGALDEVCTEDSPKNPVSEYGLDKLEAETAVLEHNNGVALRFATCFGVSPQMRVNLLVNDLVHQAYYERKLSIFQPEARRTFIHIDDFCSALVFFMQRQSSLKHNVYNVGHESNNCTKRELAELVKAKTGCEVTYSGEGFDPDLRDYAVSTARAEAEGFTVSKSISDGIDELLKVVPLMPDRMKYS